MSSRRRRPLALLMVAAVTVSWFGPQATWAAFSSATTSQLNAFEAAAAFCDPGTVTVLADADTYVDQSSVSQNNGTATALRVRSWSLTLLQRNRRALVRFPLPGIPAHCTLQSATLRLHASSASAGRILGAYRVAQAWTETAATWSNQPSTIGAAATASSGTGWVAFDVTEQAVGMYGGANHGFLVRDETEGSIGSAEQVFSSREGSDPPQLEVGYG